MTSKQTGWGVLGRVCWTASVAAWLAGPSCAVRRHQAVPQVKTPPVADPVYDFETEAESPAPPRVEPEAAGKVPDTELQTPPAHLESTPVEVQDLAPPQTPDEPSANEPSPTTQGYRVQVFAGTGEETARDLGRQVEDRVGVPTSVVFQPPYYKVRVGNCKTRAVCEELVSRLRQAGYASAWIVPSTIEP